MDFTDLIKYIVDNAYNHWCITALFIFLFNPFTINDVIKVEKTHNDEEMCRIIRNVWNLGKDDEK